ncbi:hypothetical protein D621_10925 [beta proteobacterium AAP51]|nr:hypothetical protein D621_10925 [beta proteobacterium AAP51]
MNTDELARHAGRLREAGRVEEAVAAYEKLLGVDPDRPNSWFNLGLLRRRQRQFAAALEAYAQALRRGVPGPEEAHLNRAVIYADDLRRPADAQRELEQALALNPQFVPALLNLGNLHEDLGQREAAAGCYSRVLALEPRHGLALARLAQVTQGTEPMQALLPALRAACAENRRPVAERAELGFALGRLLDGCGLYDEAFAVYTQANLHSRLSAPAPGPRYDRVAHEADITAVIDTFARAGPPPAAHVSAPSAGARPRRQPPIFVLGMFRSGSTLVEQVLASHPQVRSGGELDILPQLVARQLSPYPQAAAGLTASRCAELADDYLRELAAVLPDAGVVTDKRPDNYRYVGLIKRLFPEARIVHTHRHPLDNCLSVHFLHLAHSKAYALNLLDTGHYYLQYQRLMAHWKTLYGEDILDFDYDAFVHTPRAHTERLLAFAGLGWDERCLAFHQAASPVRTASVWQVREPLYHRASGRWRHYRQHLGELATLLGLCLGGETD